MCGQTWIDSEREFCPHGSSVHFYGIFLQGFLWPITQICLVLSLYLVYLRVLPCVCIYLPVKVDPSEETCGSSFNDEHHQRGITPFLISKEISSQESLLASENEKYVVSCLLPGQGPAFSLNSPAIDILELLSTENKLITCPGYGDHLPPASFLHGRRRCSFHILSEKVQQDHSVLLLLIPNLEIPEDDTHPQTHLNCL